MEGFDLSQTSKAYIGNNPIKSIYLKSDLIWEAPIIIATIDVTTPGRYKYTSDAQGVEKIYIDNIEQPLTQRYIYLEQGLHYINYVLTDPHVIKQYLFGYFTIPSSDAIIKFDSLVIPKSVTTIENYAFAYILSLKNIIIPENITSIGHHSFSNCNNLENVIIKGKVSSLPEFMFVSCTKLKSVTLPRSIKYNVSKAFEYNYELTEIIFEGTIEEWNNTKNTFSKTVGYGRGTPKLEVIHCLDGDVEPIFS